MCMNCVKAFADAVTEALNEAGAPPGLVIVRAVNGRVPSIESLVQDIHPDPARMFGGVL